MDKNEKIEKLKEELNDLISLLHWTPEDNISEKVLDEAIPKIINIENDFREEM